MTKNNIATFGGGCFWCIEAIFQRLNGVSKVVSGYSGGHKENPTTEEVYEGNTGHAEVVQINFNPDIISYEMLLKIFFVMHDPTTLNRQGNDIGDEYRSVIFYHDENQKMIAEKLKNEYATNIWDKKIVTQIIKFDKFWSAGPDHQDFYNKNRGAGYCQVIINPKIQKLRKQFSKYLTK